MSKDIRESIVTSQEWPLRHRVIMHSLFHQLVALERTLNAGHPMADEYLTYSCDAIAGFLHGKPIPICLDDIGVADEVFLAFYEKLGVSIDKAKLVNLNDDEEDESLNALTFISLAPVIVELLPSIYEYEEEEEIIDCFGDIVINEKDHVCNSRKLLVIALAMGRMAYDKISNVVGEEPEVENEYDEEDEYFLSDSGLIFRPNKPLYNLTNHRLAFKRLKDIATCDGFYAPGHGCIVPTFNPKPPRFIYKETTDPSSYYRNHMHKMFKSVDEHSKGEEDDLQAIEYSFKTWIRISIGKFYQGYPIEALYVISAVITEFVKGMHLGVMSRALKRVGDFQNNLKIYLKDSLGMMLFYMEYVDDEVYNKVCKRINLLAQSQKDDKLSRQLINLSPFSDYQKRRQGVNNPEISEELKKVIDTRGQRENEPIITPEEPRYYILDRMEIEETLDRISDQEGPYEVTQGTLRCSFNAHAPYWIEPADPTTYYIQRIRNIFKGIEKYSSGDEEELKAIQYSLKSWIIFALNNYSESNPVRALYIISAELTEFTKGLSNGLIAQALQTTPDVLINVHTLLKDALSLTLYFMEYVPEEAYNIVSKRLNRFIQEYKPDPKLEGLIDFKPFVDYFNERSKTVDMSQE